MKLVWTPRALAEIDAIFAYTAASDRNVAERLTFEMEAASLGSPIFRTWVDRAASKGPGNSLSAALPTSCPTASVTAVSKFWPHCTHPGSGLNPSEL